MLGKRPRPSMRRTTSMTQLGSGTGVEKSPINEYHPREKQRTPFSITPHLRAPSPGSVHNSNGFNIPNLKTHPFDAMSVNARYSSGVVKDNQPHGDALPKGTGLSLGLGLGIGVTPELASSSPIQPFVASHGQGQGQFTSSHGQGQGQFTSMYAPNHVGMQGYPMGRVGGIRESYLARSETFPPVDSTSRGYGVEMIEPARFLQACFLCKRRLGHGHDIYMYRDDRAFCSAECRQQQIVVDERKEKYSVRVMATGSVSSNQHQNFGNKNVQSGTAKNVQSERGAAG